MLEKAEYIYSEAIEAENEHWAELTLLETLEDVAILNDGLYELTPFLESIPIEYEENDELENSRQRTADPGQTTATKALHINILDKFPGAADNLPLVENLAERNMRRKERLWELKKKHESAPEPVSPSNGRGGRARSPSSYAPSTKYTMGTMRTFGSSVASVPYSLLDLQDDYAPSAASMSSFASADLDMVGITRIPPPPVRLGDGVSFECNLCFETLYGVETKYRWKYVHITRLGAFRVGVPEEFRKWFRENSCGPGTPTGGTPRELFLQFLTPTLKVPIGHGLGLILM
jgi:hypothetical protein